MTFFTRPIRHVKVLAIPLLFAVGCASTPCPPQPIPEPIIKIVRVEVPVPVPCQLSLDAPVPPPASDDNVQWLSDWITTLEAWVDATIAELQ
jgi:hypothetical protein